MCLYFLLLAAYVIHKQKHLLTDVFGNIYGSSFAPVAELVDAADSKSAVLRDLPVRVRSGAPPH